MAEASVRFTATLGRDTINVVVDVPAAASAALAKASGKRGQIPVQVKLGRTKGTHPQTLIPLGGGRHRLYVNEAMLKAARLGEGDRVASLAADPDASATFDALAPSRRKEVLRYLTNLKSQAALERNVAKFVATLAAGDSPFRAKDAGGPKPGTHRRVKPRFADVDDYLTKLPPDAAAALATVRAIVHKVAPKVQESISYDMPTFKVPGHSHGLGLAAFKAHWSLFGATRDLVKAVPAAAAFNNGKGTLRFPLDEPVPVALVKAIARFRLGQAS
jgi:uncharacterized protein YdhG (YjbR/CyaY superfamily)